MHSGRKSLLLPRPPAPQPQKRKTVTTVAGGEVGAKAEAESEKPAVAKKSTGGAADKNNPDDELIKLEREAAARKEKRVAEELEKIEYNTFPTILGWYFDGVFTANFTLNEEFAEYFNEIEEEIEAKQDLEIEETFTEKVARNFWPPKWLGPVFRTRGVYLDLPEVKEDPPKTPPEMNFERQHAVIGIGLGDDLGEDTKAHLHFGNIEYSSASGRRPHDKRDQFYWEDETREFLHKVDDEYEWWDKDKVWRKKSPEGRTPYSWYWDPREGKYFIRDKAKPDDYVFDQIANIYKKKGEEGLSKNGKGSHDYYYCETTNKWLPLSDAQAGETEVYTNGKRQIKKGERGKSGLGPDDYYYSAESGIMELKDKLSPIDYYYDTKDQIFRKMGEPYGPGKSGMYPTDYKFSVKDGEWLPKNPREFFKPSPYDWYFDAAQGRFFLRDKTQRSDYDFDHVANIWKMKGVKGPSSNGLGPEDYVYDEQSKAWKLENAFMDLEITAHETCKRKIRKGLRGTSGKTDDDYYYDALLGEFLLKDPTKLDKYFFDPNEDIFRKTGQPYGPGKSKLFPYHYYFDEIDGEWALTSEAKTYQARQKQEPPLQLITSQFKTAYDFAFDADEGVFVLRDVLRPHDYEYNPKKGVYFIKGTTGPSRNGTTVGDYYFDEQLYNWLPLESPKGHEAKDYKNGHRNNRTGTRGKTGKIPDDFYFSEGNFIEKDHSNPEKYLYDIKVGVWKLVNPPPDDAKPGLPHPQDFFFSYEDGMFIPKTQLKFGEISLDKNSQLWIQRYRVPTDYEWDGKGYVLKAAKRYPGHGGLTEKAKANFEKAQHPIIPAYIKPKIKEIDYEKPWLNNYPYLAATKERFEDELNKAKKQKKKAKQKKPSIQKPPPAADNVTEEPRKSKSKRKTRKSDPIENSTNQDTTPA